MMMKFIVLAVIFIIIIYLFLIFPSLKKRSLMQQFDDHIFAHRGYHNIHMGIPENSMTAFKRALDTGYGIEIDLHLTKDKRLMVFHDHSLLRVCGIDKKIEDCTASELMKLRLLQTDEGIPTFEDFLTLVDGRVPILIELKVEYTSVEICSYVVEALKDYNGPVLIQSFSPFILRWFKKNAGDFLRGQLSSNMVKTDKSQGIIPRFLLTHLLSNVLARPDFISYSFNYVDRFSTFLLHRVLRLPYAVWTIRREKVYKKVKGQYNMYILEDFEILNK